jgi:hypothetical protein
MCRQHADLLCADLVYSQLSIESAFDTVTGFPGPDYIRLESPETVLL